MRFDFLKNLQDLPPKGGYPPINHSRITLRTFMKGRYACGFFVLVNVFGMPLYHENQRILKRLEIAKKSDELAIYPIFLAEMDRNILRYMKKARDLESRIMKNFPKWEVGTYFGVRRYESISDDTYVIPTTVEFYMFSPDFNPSGMLFAR